MNKFPLVICITLFLLSLISCTEEFQQGVSFDEEEFSLQKSKWEALGIENYSFTYSFGKGSIWFYVVGKVSVVEGKANPVVFDTEYSYYTEEIDSSSEYYLEDMNAVFDVIYNSYLESIEKSIINNSFIKYNLFYESKYEFPRQATNYEDKNEASSKESSAGQPNDNFYLEISDFQCN